MKKKSIKKCSKMVKKFILLLFTSGIIVALIELWYSDKSTKPETWIQIDSLELMSYPIFEQSNFNYPSEISVESYKSFVNIFEDSFIINLHIKNTSENEIVLSNMKFNMSQYQYDFPVLAAKGYIKDNNYMIDIINYSNQNVNNLEVYLYDDENILQEICGDKTYTLIPEVKEGETKSILFFNFDDIAGKKIDSWMLKPNIIVKDPTGNTLFINLKEISLNKDKYKSYIEKQGSTAFLKIDKYSYDITPDIIINNEEVNLKEIVEYIPAHEILNLKLLITSQVTCAFDLKMTYKLDDTRYEEKEMNFIIYNPEHTSKDYGYINEYIEIK